MQQENEQSFSARFGGWKKGIAMMLIGPVILGGLLALGVGPAFAAALGFKGVGMVASLVSLVPTAIASGLMLRFPRQTVGLLSYSADIALNVLGLNAPKKDVRPADVVDPVFTPPHLEGAPELFRDAPLSGRTLPPLSDYRQKEVVLPKETRGGAFTQKH